MQRKDNAIYWVRVSKINELTVVTITILRISFSLNQKPVWSFVCYSRSTDKFSPHAARRGAFAWTGGAVSRPFWSKTLTTQRLSPSFPATFPDHRRNAWLEQDFQWIPYTTTASIIPFHRWLYLSGSRIRACTHSSAYPPTIFRRLTNNALQNCIDVLPLLLFETRVDVQ